MIIPRRFEEFADVWTSYICDPGIRQRAFNCANCTVRVCRMDSKIVTNFLSNSGISMRFTWHDTS